MGAHSARRRRHRRRIVAALCGAALVLGGTGAVAFALANQVHPPEPATPARQETAAGEYTALPAGAALASVIGRLRAELDPLTLPPSRPVALLIPAIGLQTPVGEVGRTASGAIEVPPLYERPSVAAWYRRSPTPGQRGPAIIVGHVDDSLGPAVFFRLGALTPGDTIEVRRADGTVAVFRVNRVRRVAKAAFPSDAVYGPTPRAALRLITCGGPFDSADHSYLDSVVVFANLIAVRR